MKHGFLKVAAATPVIKVANCKYNAKQIINIINDVNQNKVKILVLPELCITGYTCGDLFFQRELIDSASDALLDIVGCTKGLDMLIAIGLPIYHRSKLFNCAAIVFNGEILGFVPKSFLPNHSEFCDKRHFKEPNNENQTVLFKGKTYPFGTKILFSCENMPELKIAVEICEDVWAPLPPSTRHSLAGATVILNLSASNELVEKDSYRQMLIKSQSAKTISAYIFADAGEGESTTDMVFAAHNMIFENGVLLKEGKLFKNQTIISEIDLQLLNGERNRNTTFPVCEREDYKVINFTLNQEKTKLSRYINKTPFIPKEKENMKNRCDTILAIQAQGLKKRILHTNAKKIIIGISGGMDSSFALLVAKYTLDILGRKASDIIAISMPCFGTSERTRNNAQKLCEKLEIDFREIDITDSVKQHFKDIGHDINRHDIVFENAQARMRTLELMDVANKEGGIVLGTGDLSELALGWATYGGDHLSMYNVNASVPKTLMKHLIQYIANKCEDKELSEILLDILDTPISPELLPHDDGNLTQKTEELIGPYELHDFFLNYILRFGFSPDKIYSLACYAFEKDFEKTEILKWLKIFYKRFFAQQFKRSCMPDGPKVGTVSLSPRSDFKMPSDCSYDLWNEKLKELV